LLTNVRKMTEKNEWEIPRGGKKGGAQLGNMGDLYTRRGVEDKTQERSAVSAT